MSAPSSPWSQWNWQDMPMPDANMAIQCVQLEAAEPHQFLAMVRFPPGWQRLHGGHYAVDEEFFVLSGDLHVNGVCWQTQQHGFVPAHTLRSDTHSHGGCTAYARFYGRPRWLRGSAASQPVGAIARITDWRLVSATACAGSTRARLLHRGDGTSSWLLEAWPEAGLPLGAESMDVLSIDTLSHCHGVGCVDQCMPVGPALLHRADLHRTTTAH